MYDIVVLNNIHLATKMNLISSKLSILCPFQYFDVKNGGHLGKLNGTAIGSYFFTFFYIFGFSTKFRKRLGALSKDMAKKRPYLPTPSNVIGNKENVNALFMNKGGRLASGHLPS